MAAGSLLSLFFFLHRLRGGHAPVARSKFKSYLQRRAPLKGSHDILMFKTSIHRVQFTTVEWVFVGYVCKSYSNKPGEVANEQR